MHLASGSRSSNLHGMGVASRQYAYPRRLGVTLGQSVDRGADPFFAWDSLLPPGGQFVWISKEKRC